MKTCVVSLLVLSFSLVSCAAFKEGPPPIDPVTGEKIINTTQAISAWVPEWSSVINSVVSAVVGGAMAVGAPKALKKKPKV